MAGPIYSGGPIININYTTGSVSAGTDVINAFIANMPAAGWTHGTIAATDVATFSGQPANNDTISLDTSGAGNKTYTFKTVISVANDVLIDLTVAATIQNLMNAIIAGPGSGTKYGTGTVANTTIGVSATTATTITFAYVTSGSAGNSAVISKSSANITLAAGSLSGGMDTFLSKITPQGLQWKFGLGTLSGSFYDPGAKLIYYFGDRTFTRLASEQLQNGATPSNTHYRLIANPYQFFHFAIGATNNQDAGYWIAGGVPFVPTLQQALIISSATNASPIQCTTSTTNPFVTGDQVLIAGAVGNTAANGIFTITVIDTSNFTLNGSAGNGTYTANSAFVGDITSNAQTVEAIWAQFTAIGGGNNFRNSMVVNGLDWTSFNSFTRGYNNGSDVGQLLKSYELGNSAPKTVQWSNGNFLSYEAAILWGISVSAPPYLMGLLWDSFVIANNVTLEQTFSADTPMHNFMIVGIDASQQTSLAVAIT